MEEGGSVPGGEKPGTTGGRSRTPFSTFLIFIVSKIRVSQNKGSIVFPRTTWTVLGSMEGLFITGSKVTKNLTASSNCLLKTSLFCACMDWTSMSIETLEVKLSCVA